MRTRCSRKCPPKTCSPPKPHPAPEKTEPEQAPNKTDTWDDQDYEYFFGDYLDDGYRPKAPQEVKELPPIENTLSTSSSLSDHLMWQLSMQTDDALMREIGSAIIGNLDDDGYLVASFEELAAMGPWPVSDVERGLAMIQGFDPTGVAARDLQECLQLQLRHLGLEGTPTDKIVTEHLRLLQNHQVPEIARKLGMTIDDLKEHVEVIRHLDPKPGSRYNPTQSQYVIPDVYVMKVEDEYVVVLNEDGLPQMRISPVYRRLLDKTAVDNTDETRAYVKDKFRSALWLIKSVEQRQKTIFKVAKSIVNFQRDFLDHGIEHLRPLVLRDVANDIGMHESTVSRVVTNKYMHTPQGVFEMKYFFHSGISSSYGESVSSVTIKQRIRKIIENEDPRKPLSDSKIVSILQREGLVLARRTIAKYREELKIPTSNQRKVSVTQPLADVSATASAERPICDSNSPAVTSTSLPRFAGSSNIKIGKLERVLNDSAVSAQAVLTREKHRHRTDITLHARGEKFLHGVGDSSSWETSLSAAIGKISHQAQKIKGKYQARKRQGGAKDAPAVPEHREAVAVRPAGRAAPARVRMPRIVRASRQTIKPMSVAEAAKEMDIAREGVVIFRDPATEGINVLYRRPNGELALVETEA